MSGNPKLDLIAFLVVTAVGILDHVLAQSKWAKSNSTGQLIVHLLDGGLKNIKAQPSGIVEAVISAAAPVAEKAIETAIDAKPTTKQAETAEPTDGPGSGHDLTSMS